MGLVMSHSRARQSAESLLTLLPLENLLTLNRTMERIPRLKIQGVSKIAVLRIRRFDQSVQHGEPIEQHISFALFGAERPIHEIDLCPASTAKQAANGLPDHDKLVPYKFRIIVIGHGGDASPPRKQPLIPGVVRAPAKLAPPLDYAIALAQ